MHDFVLKEIVNSNLKKELENVGFDKSYAKFAVDKFRYKNIKIFDLTCAQANILKQTALSVGADCATHKSVIEGKIEKSDCILGASVSQIKKIAQKLQAQPFGLKKLGEMLEKFDTSKTAKTKIVGVLNLTKDSFSDGYFEYDDAIEHLKELEDADIIELGAESTKPYSHPVPDDAQLERILPVLKYLNGKTVSIDTRSSKVAEECLKCGAQIINDVSGFDFDPNMPDIIAKYGAKVVIQHSKGAPETMQDNPQYDNLIEEIYMSLKNKIDLAVSRGIDRENIIIDVGLGFGKKREDNFELIKRIEEFYSLGCPVMLGISRKSFLGCDDNLTRDIFTVALNTLAIERKVDYIRVHNVKLHKKLIEILNLFSS